MTVVGVVLYEKASFSLKDRNTDGLKLADVKYKTISS